MFDNLVKETVEEVLVQNVDISDECASYSGDLIQKVRDFNFPPRFEEDGSTDDEIDEWFEKSGVNKLQHDFLEKIEKKIKNQIMKNLAKRLKEKY